VEKIRTIGLFTKGIIYGLIGILALLAALGVGGQAAGTSGVLNFLREQPFGRFLVILIGIGLAGYAIWRIYQALVDPTNEGDDKTGTAKRIGYFVSGAIYGTLGVSILTSNGSSSGSGSKQSWASWLLNQDYGQTLMIVLAIILLGVSIYKIYKGLSKKFLEDVRDRGRVTHQKLLERSGMVGISARGVAFGIFAYFVYRTAVNNNPGAVGGMEGMFDFLQNQSGGTFLVGLMAVGLLAYGIYQFYLGNNTKVYIKKTQLST